MRHLFTIFVGIAAILAPARIARAEKVMVYDEEKGIIFVEKGADGKIVQPKQDYPSKSPAPKPKDGSQASTAAPRPASARDDIHLDRAKDPPELYLKSGLEYFKNRNYESALRNFTHADSVDPKPEYTLWVGKTQRQLGRFDRMLFTMQRILSVYPESDVADDALFEIAFYHQSTGNYDSAIALYTKLSEQYPFGTSYSNGEAFRDIAKEQRQAMKAEMVSTLKLLGIPGDEAPDLYTAFQKARGLPITGRADRETVQAVKAAHQKYLEEEAEKAQLSVRLARHQAWAYIVGSFVILNVLITILLRIRIVGRARQLTSLEQVLSELNTKSL